MNNFSKFISCLETEKPKKLAVFAYARMNPPTRGHSRLVDTIKLEADRLGGDAILFPSRTHDPKKNPLTPKEKIQFITELFTDINIVDDETVKNPFSALRWLLQHDYTDIVIVGGSDRIEDYETRLRPAAEKTFNSVSVVSAGLRDPDADDLSGMSATKARRAAANDDLAGFRVATGWHDDVSERMMLAIRREMNE